MGARPMERLIEEKLKKPLAEELLFGTFQHEGGEVRIGVENGRLQIQIINQSEIIASSQQRYHVNDQPIRLFGRLLLPGRGFPVSR